MTSTKHKVMVRLTVEYEAEYPIDMDAYDVDFHRNESSWCADNALKELQAIVDGSSSCLCSMCEFEVIES